MSFDLSRFNKLVRERTQQMIDERNALRSRLREPDLIEPNTEDGYETGYWRHEDGITVLYRIVGGKWRIESPISVMSPNDLKRIIALAGLPPVKMLKDRDHVDA